MSALFPGFLKLTLIFSGANSLHVQTARESIKAEDTQWKGNDW